MQLRIEEIQLYWKFIQQYDFVLGLSVFTLFANNFSVFCLSPCQQWKIKIERYYRCVFLVYWYNDVMWMWGENNLICTNFWIMKRARWKTNLFMCYVSVFEMDLTFTHRPSSLYLCTSLFSYIYINVYSWCDGWQSGWYNFH